MKVDLISCNHVSRIREVLLQKNLFEFKPIEIIFKELKLSLYIDSVSKASETQRFDHDMQEVFFVQKNERNVLKINNKYYELFYNVGEWRNNTRISDSHICLGTNPKKFGSDYFCQIELSQGLEDDEYIYIVKKISKLAGKGAITRLNSGLKSNKEKKHLRREKLVRELNAQVINYDLEDWICIEKISIKDLYEKDKIQDILYSFMSKILRYTFTIEKIIYQSKKIY